MKYLVTLLFGLVSIIASAQVTGSKGTICLTEVVEGDTVALVVLDPAVISGPRVFRSKRDERKYRRLEKKVLKVYPYAWAAGVLMRDYEAELASLHTERERKRYLKEAEESLKKRFEGELRNMRVSEGVLLIKLIDRETGDTSYGLVQELKGNFSAFMWQSVARLFGHNLKDDYDPNGADKDVEEIIRDIEYGILQCQLPSKEELRAENAAREKRR